MNVATNSHWLNLLRKLNPNRSRVKGTAPHKPCLLLSLLDMAQDGELQEPELRRTPSLNVRFNAFSSLALPRWGGKVDLAYPFFYLKSQGFWQALDAERCPSTSVDETQSIRLNPEFLTLMQDEDFRRSARIILVETYFPPAERIALYALLGVRTQTLEFQKEMHLLNPDTATQAVEQGRSARFGVQVVCGYQHTCAFTGYRIITQNGESVVEAAHIEPWAQTRNDDIHMVAYNLALCERLRTSAGKLRLERGSITVRSSESIAAEILEAAGISHEVPAERVEAQRYFDETLPLLAIESLTTEAGSLGHLMGKYDALVVDEAQDHDTALPGASSQPDHVGWWSIYVALLRQGWQSPMAIFGDVAQRPPFRAQDRFELNSVRQRLVQHAHLRLNRALRYTRPIYRFLKELQGEGSHDLAASLQTDGQLPDGPEVEIHQAMATQTPAVVEQILDHWKTSGLCVPSKVLILHDRSQIGNTPLAGLERLLDHPLRPYLETLDQPSSNAIGHTSIHKAKGLDALAVILVGLPAFAQLTRPYDRFTYFMGASRARQLLACVHMA